LYIHELELAIQLAKEGGKLAQSIRARGYSVQEKADNQGPATDADLEVSHLLFNAIRQDFPLDTIVSEEAIPPLSSQNTRIWFIDPIDGTKEFMKGQSDWSVMIGLAVEGIPVLGVVYRPDEDELYYARSTGGAFFCTIESTVQLQVNSISDPSASILIQSRSHPSIEAVHLAKTLGVTQTFSLGSIGLKLGKIAEGKADMYFNFSGRCHLWDLCGPEAILREAGGIVVLSSGKRIHYDLDNIKLQDNFVATQQNLFTRIVPLLQTSVLRFS
jgi:3'(2'), 5'-bisphosphate nucleotidase